MSKSKKKRVSVIISGSIGSGKTVVLHTIINALRAKGFDVSAFESTGRRQSDIVHVVETVEHNVALPDTHIIVQTKTTDHA